MRAAAAFALAFWVAFGLVSGGSTALTVIRLVGQAKCALGVGTCSATEPASPVRWRWPV